MINTIDEAVEALEEVVAAKGADHVYKPHKGSYRYNHGDEPGCIVGHVLAIHAPDTYAKLSEFEQKYNQASGNITALNVLATTATGVRTEVGDDKVLRILRHAQRAQDRGATWGEALAEAKLMANAMNSYYKESKK